MNNEIKFLYLRLILINITKNLFKNINLNVYLKYDS